jgi:outer membrane lipoprotein-sorting protein
MFLVLMAPILAPAAPPNAELLQGVLSRMDKAAGDFKAMTAQVTYLTHTDVLNEDSTESGTAMMKKLPNGEVQGLVNFVAPDPRTIMFEKRRVKRYYPKIKRLEIYDLDKHGAQLDKFVLIGFGISGAELTRDFDVSVLGTEALKGQPGQRAIQLHLVPKTGEAKQYVKSVDLWIPEQGEPYPVREKILQLSADYQVITYSDLKINPTLAADALQPKLPAGVETVYPGK